MINLNFLTNKHQVVLKRAKSKAYFAITDNLPHLNTQSKIANSINEFELKFESLYKKIYLNYNEIETLSSSVLQEAIEGKLVKFEKFLTLMRF